MSLCFIQLAHKVPLLGSFQTARDSGLGSPRRVRAESQHPELPAAKRVGGEGGGLLLLVKVKGYWGDIPLCARVCACVCACVCLQFVEPVVFKGLFPWEVRDEKAESTIFVAGWFNETF